MDMALAEGQTRIGRRPRKNWPKAKNALAKCQSPPQELEVSPRSGLYLVVANNITNGAQKIYSSKYWEKFDSCVWYCIIFSLPLGRAEWRCSSVVHPNSARSSSRNVVTLDSTTGRRISSQCLVTCDVTQVTRNSHTKQAVKKIHSVMHV